MLFVDSIAVQDVLFPVFPKEITHVWGSDGLRLQNTHYTSLDNGWRRAVHCATLESAVAFCCLFRFLLSRMLGPMDDSNPRIISAIASNIAVPPVSPPRKPELVPGATFPMQDLKRYEKQHHCRARADQSGRRVLQHKYEDDGG
jgi:hypothetical protein